LDRFDPWDLDDVRERVVRPVISSLIKAADVKQLLLGWGPQKAANHWRAGIDVEDWKEQLWLLVRVEDSTWHSQIWMPDMAEQLDTLAEVAGWLADRLEGWVCECVYWGEQAIARAIIPARRT
jgi:hypothetical protein